MLKCRPFFNRPNGFTSEFMRFFSIFTLLVMQLFTYFFARFVLWVFQVRGKSARRCVYLLSFVFGNGLLLLTLTRMFPAMFRISAVWMVLLLFVCFTLLIVSVLRLAGRHVFRQPEKLENALRLAASLILVGLFGLALWNAYMPVVKRAAIQISKPLGKPVRVAMAADTHLGALVGRRQIDKLAAIIKREQADVVLLPGDIMDDDTRVYEAEQMAKSLSQLRAPLGVYATLGNHDLFGHDVEITQALEDAGIVVLTDRAVKVDNRFWIAGRPDQLDKHRLKTADLLKQTDVREPVFLVDHRPTDVLVHAELPIDVQVSGHVHNGQVFPANLVVRALYDIHYGYQQINNSHFFVTSGFGFWGVPFRLGSQAEVWIIDVYGNDTPLPENLSAGVL